MNRLRRTAAAVTACLALALGIGAVGAVSASPGTSSVTVAPMPSAAAPTGRLTTLVTLAHDLTTWNIPYSHGGHGPKPAPLGASVDCSGLVRQLYWTAFGFDIGAGSGDSMVRTSGHFAKVTSPIPGDVALFGRSGVAPAYHAFIYVGSDAKGNPIGVGSPDFGSFVKYQYPNSSNWGRDLLGYWRFNQVTPQDSLPTGDGPLVDGDFVVVAGKPEVYRIAGGAPLYVSSWTEFGGQQPYRTIQKADFDELPTVPADGTFIAAGGNAYRIAGGAPLYVSSWAPFGGAKPYTVVDPLAVTLAGRGGVWDHLRAVPADGTFIAAGGHAYRIAGGAPLYVSSWAPFGGAKPYTVVDPAAVTQAGQSGVWRFLNLRPADGTFVAAGGHAYRIVGGAPVYVSSWSPFGGAKPYTVIDPAAVAAAGQSGTARHLLLWPADGTFIAAGGNAYRMAGGAPLYISSWAPFGGPQPYTVIDPAAELNAGQPGIWQHLSEFPADGTFIAAGGHAHRVAGGIAAYVESWAPFGGPQPYTVVDPAALTSAGQSGPFRHLAGVS